MRQGSGLRTVGTRSRLVNLFEGQRVGRTTRDFPQRAAALSATLFNALQGANPVEADALVWDFSERNDAYSYIVLGDPAVRLRT